jgi:hypothetical protein
MSYRLGYASVFAFSAMSSILLALSLPGQSAIATYLESPSYLRANYVNLVAAIGGSPCHSARVAYNTAKAAASAAEDEKALELFQSAIEQFELCRSSETPGSASALNDEALEVDSQILAAGYLTDTDEQRARSLYISAWGLLSELCARQSLPDETRRFFWVDVKLFRVFAPRIGLDALATNACPSMNMPAPTPSP